MEVLPYKTNKPLLVIGTIFVDIKGYPFGGYNPAGRNVGEVITLYGGVGFNIAVDCAKCGAKVLFAATCDDGARGSEIVSKLSDCGVDTGLLLPVTGGGTGVWLAVFDEKGELAGSISQMPPLDRLEDYLQSEGERIMHSVGAVALELDLSTGITERAIALAGSNGIPIYGVVGNMAVVMENKGLICGIDCFFCNELEASRFFDKDFVSMDCRQIVEFLPEAAKHAGLRSVVVTLGARGSVWYDHFLDKSGYEPAIATEICDTAGAGDAFFAASVVRLMSGDALSEAVKSGTKAASSVISSISSTL